MNGDFNKNRQGNGRPPQRPQGSTNRPPQGGRPGGGYPQPLALEKITAPYNFVPLSRKVFFPDWSQHVSLDVPFADAISGELVCELVTDTPVYVRNGGKWEHHDIMNNKEAQSFFRVGEQIMIPGTTLKGMLRNVIEIVSFGKMNKFDNHRYSIRDLKNQDLYMNKMKNVQAAWLQRSESGTSWLLVPCEYALVSHELLGNPSIKDAQKALSKYSTWGWDKLDVRFTFKKGSLANRVTSIEKGEPGRLVFTGQPTKNRGGKFDKKNEFVFFGQSKGSPIEVPPEVQNDIVFIYTNPNTGKPYEEWAHWSDQLGKGAKIPVFYQMNGSKLGSFGFTRMYRLPYEKTVRQVVEQTSKDHVHTDPDLAETIFGIAERDDSLKGRISISTAVAELKTVKPFNEAVTAVLGSPKPTFYPNYIYQPRAGSDGKLTKTGSYETFMSSESTINGWKRYPTRELKDVERKPDMGKDTVATKFIPLSEGAKFSFSVKLHNLKPEELGAIVWALTWGNNNKLRHSLGMGKSLGFGIAAITISSAHLVDIAGEKIDWQDTLRSFEGIMNTEVGGEWLKTAQLEQLLAMANPVVVAQCGKLKHMTLANKDFSNVKGGVKPPTPSLALLPHVRPTALPDRERFKNLQPRKTDAATGRSKQVQTVPEPDAKGNVPADVAPPDLSALDALRNKFKKR
jgi:CRISPR-associated protein (TIGR03986 family)